MPKSGLMVTVLTISILASFGVIVSLMQTVNPPPYKNAKPAIEDNIRKTGDTEDDFEDNLIVPVGFDHDQPRDADTIDSNSSDHFIDSDLDANNTVDVHATLESPLRTTLFKQNNTTRTESIVNVTESTESVGNKTESTDKYISSPHSKTRRSFDTQYLNRKSGPVILKILDDTGEPKIEIKLLPALAKKRNYRSSLKKAGAVFNYDNKMDYEDSGNNTEIIIMPNYTVLVLNNNLTEEFLENLSSRPKPLGISLKDKINVTYSMESVEEEVPNVNNLTFNDSKHIELDVKPLALQVMIDNETKIITNYNAEDQVSSDPLNLNHTDILAHTNLTEFIGF